MSPIEKAYKELADWVNVDPSNRSFQITYASAGVIAVLNAVTQCAVGSGSDLTYAVDAAMKDWGSKYPTPEEVTTDGH